MNHVTSIQLCAFLDDVLVGAPDDQTARHLATCPMCRARYEAWCHVDDSLRELLGQDPDEHAMEQRTAWVEIAVTAERKGLPAPEFGELRIPLESRPAPRAAAVAQAPPSHFAPPPVEQVPPALASRTGSPTGTPMSSAPVKRPVVHVPLPTASHASPPPTVAPPPAPAWVGAGRGQALAKAAKAGTEPASRPAPGARTPGYARMPRPPRRGLAALATRPGLWITLLVAFTLVASVVKFGIHRIQLALRESQATGDVHEAVADARTDRDPDVAPARSSDQRPRRGVPARSTAPAPSSSAGAVPEEDAPNDASILFDLPALEPEDGEPDPVVTPPNRLSPTEGREVPASRTGGAADLDPDRPGICGEVRSTQGTPIEGARVYLASPARMVRTDRKGRFCVVCPPGPRTVRVEASGRATVKRTLQVGKGRLETRFTLDAAN